MIYSYSIIFTLADETFIAGTEVTNTQDSGNGQKWATEIEIPQTITQSETTNHSNSVEEGLEKRVKQKQAELEVLEAEIDQGRAILERLKREEQIKPRKISL